LQSPLLILGCIILIATFREVFQAVLVPRGKMRTVRMLPSIVRHALWPIYRRIALIYRSPFWHAEILGLFAPLVSIFMLISWVSVIVIGFGLIILALGNEFQPPVHSLGTAMYVAGSNVLTIGCSDYIGKTDGVRFIMLAAALSGMIITASVISLLFTLINSIQRREVLVAITSSIAGSPPSGIAILESFGSNYNSLSNFFDRWQVWCADVIETHSAYLLLPYFYSTDPFTSWITALGSILDAAALVMSSDLSSDVFSAKHTFDLGCKLVDQIRENFRLIPHESEISSEELDLLFERFRVLLPTLETNSQTKQQFLKLRKRYAPAQQAICLHISAPCTPLMPSSNTHINSDSTKSHGTVTN
jgi:hypothetical protein